jgi:hypothetical protein
MNSIVASATESQQATLPPVKIESAPTSDAPQTTDDNDASGSSFRDRVLAAMVGKPELAKNLQKVLESETQRHRDKDERELRRLGLISLASLSFLTIATAVVIPFIDGPIYPVVGLLSIGAACAGALAGIATGAMVRPGEFTKMLLGRFGGRRNNNGGNETTESGEKK